jgi:hypothetical protein
VLVFYAPGDLDTKNWGRDGGEYSTDDGYRWSYGRRWREGPLACWILLNPATGDSEGRPRPTLSRMVSWSDGHGFGGIAIVNLFAWRATKPRDLRHAARQNICIVGARNDEAIIDAADCAGITIAAWGSHGALQSRGDEVIRLLRGTDLQCLGTTLRSRQPRHPLRFPAPWTPRPIWTT